jgi:hypothetical protein
MVISVDPDHILLYFAHRDDISPSDDVEWWGVEGVAEVIDLGCPRDWLKLARAVVADPYGLPGEYLLKCSLSAAERRELLAALNATLQSAINEEPDPIRHVVAVLPGLPGKGPWIAG